MTSQNRIGYIDGAKAIGILLVVIGHGYCLMNDDHIPIKALFRTIYSFHMPLFFILAGYFSKSMSFRYSVPKYAKAYLKPLAITCFLSLVLLIGDTIFRVGNPGFIIEQTKHWIANIFYGFITSRSSFKISEPFLGPIWFLWALFWARVIHSYMLKKLSLLDCSWVAIGMFLLAWISISLIKRLPLCIQASFMAVVFLHAGYLIRHFGFEKMFRGMHIIGHVSAIFVWLLCINTNFNFKGLVFPLNLLHLIGGLVPTLYLLWICDLLKFKGGVVGRTTLCILCGHVLALQIRKYFWVVCTCTPYYFVNFMLESLLIIILTAIMSFALFRTGLVKV